MVGSGARKCAEGQIIMRLWTGLRCLDLILRAVGF